MSNSKEKLFSEFAPVSTEQWMEKIVTDLKGADFEKKLVWKTNEGINVKPFYREEDISKMSKIVDSLPGGFPFVRGIKKESNWYIRQEIDVDDIEVANEKALDILNKGVNSLGFNIPKDKVNKENIEKLLEGIDPESVELNFRTCKDYSIELIKILVSFYQVGGYNVKKCVGSVNMDFISPILRKGKITDNWIGKITEAVAATKFLPRFRVLGVNIFYLNNSGAYITQELGYALAWGNELLSKLAVAGVDPMLVARKIKFNFGIGSNYFMEIAKFRAARWLWTEIVNVYQPFTDDIYNYVTWLKDEVIGGNQPGCPNDCPHLEEGRNCRCAEKMFVCAQTSTFNQTVYDAHVNMLRSQTEAMSAAIAGVDSILIHPFDSSFKNSDDFSERIARNQQLLLKEESHLNKVTDAAGGSYYIENLTASIAEQAWKIFLECEEKGFLDMVKKGEIQKAVNESAEARRKAVAQRREILLGTNQFPNFTEKAAGKIQEHTCGCGCNEKGDTQIETLNTKRLSSDFEDLRLATEKSGKTPKAFMLTIGSLAMRLARSQFSCNFLACAGYQVIDNLGFETIEEGVKAAREVNADIIVLCSSDEEYATFAPETYKLTKGKEMLVVAGAPANMDELKAQGIEHFINVKSNVLETLKSFNKQLI